jgi:acetyl-CoA carboxylase biotin carboxyl carrier protein
MKKRKGALLKGAAKDAAKDGKSGLKGASSSVVDFDTVRELARIATEFDLSEVEADATGRVRVSRGVARVATASAPVHAPGPSSPATLSVMPPPPASTSEAGPVISSPFVGTFYRAPSPEASSFVEVGQTVRKGQVVCIVEAMKLMNEIESDFDGKVVDVLVKNGEHVEYGQALFRLEKA